MWSGAGYCYERDGRYCRSLRLEVDVAGVGWGFLFQPTTNHLHTPL